ncbi:MAG: hypothetical protein ABI586_02855 [Candidatus Nanopelagicales bacterium]
MRKSLSLLALVMVTTTTVLSTSFPAQAQVERFSDAVGDTQSRSDVRWVKIRHSKVDNRLHVRTKLDQVVTGVEWTVYLDSRRHNPGPEWAMTAYPDSEWVLNKVDKWDDKGTATDCAGSVHFSTSTKPVARWSNKRSCLDLNRYVRVSVRIHDTGHGIDWAPARRGYSQWVSAGR